MHKHFSILILALIFGGCGDSNQKIDDSSKTPEIKITQDVIKNQNISKSDKSNSGQFYYSYNKEKNSSTQKRRSTLDAYLNIRSPYERVRVELLINKLSKILGIKCSPCPWMIIPNGGVKWGHNFLVGKKKKEGGVFYTPYKRRF